MTDLESRGTRRWATVRVLVLVGASVLVSGIAHARPGLDDARLGELDRYQVLTFVDAYQGSLERGKAIGVIDATTEEVFRVATDFSKYREFMPRVVDSSQLSRTDDTAQVMLTAELPWPAGRTWIEADYKMEKLAGGIYRIRFDMRRGNMKKYLGALYIEPWAANRTAITYELVAEPNVVAPKTVLNRGVRRSAGNFIHALRQHINELHRLGMLHPLQPAVAVAPATVVAPNPATLKAGR